MVLEKLRIIGNHEDMFSAVSATSKTCINAITRVIKDCSEQLGIDGSTRFEDTFTNMLHPIDNNSQYCL
jgi:hypothetical protein